MNSSSIILSTSDWIQLLGIIASLVTSIIAIFISIFTLRQNSKMIEASSRPVLSIYGESINPGYPMFYIVVKTLDHLPPSLRSLITILTFLPHTVHTKAKIF